MYAYGYTDQKQQTNLLYDSLQMFH